MARSRSVEDQHCRALWAWAQTQAILKDYLYHIPNGGSRTPREGANFKAIGVKGGVSDYHLPVARGAYIGLYIEMKRPGGRESKAQKAWGKSVEAVGHCYRCCQGWDEAREVLTWYLALKNPYPWVG